MKVVIYIRVSTQGQALEDKYSLRAQESELTSYVKNMGWHLVDIISDVDSGGKFAKAGLQTVMDFAEEGKMDIVLVLDQSRLSRLDGLHWEMLKAVLKENDVKLAEPGRMVDLNDDVQEFMSDIQNWFARRGRKDIVKTMMRGKRQMMREGRPWGRVPYEYIYDKNTRIVSINEQYAWSIPMIDELYLKDQLGMLAIANRLNEVSWTAAGKPWNERTVHHRLVSKAFHGVMEKTFASGETITIDDVYPPLRTLETYNEIQKEMQLRSKVYRPNFTKKHKRVHMLRRVDIKCGHCERVIAVENHGRTVNNVPYFYLKHGRKRRLSDGLTCDISINTARLDHNLSKAIKDILTNESLAKQYIDIDFSHDDFKQLQKNQKQLDKNIIKLQNKIDRLVDLYLDGEFDKNDLDKRKQNIENELSTYKEQKAQTDSKIELMERNQWNYDMIQEYMIIAQDFDDNLTQLERSQMIGNLFPKATLYKDKLILQAVMPNGAPLDVEVKIDEDMNTWHHTKK
jgi:site-specific DNA recombinase